MPSNAASRSRQDQQTFAGHLWVITDVDDNCVTILEAVEQVDGMSWEIELD